MAGKPRAMRVLIVGVVIAAPVAYVGWRYGGDSWKDSSANIKMIGAYWRVSLGMSLDDLLEVMDTPPRHETTELDMSGYDCPDSVLDDADRTEATRFYYWYNSSDVMYVFGCSAKEMVVFKYVADPLPKEPPED